jgi:hypothetical protein
MEDLCIKIKSKKLGKSGKVSYRNFGIGKGENTQEKNRAYWKKIMHKANRTA